jgi:hypothetical protein
MRKRDLAAVADPGSSGLFDEWLEHYRETTGRPVRGSKPARKQFAARLDDGYTLDDLKLATVGCHGDKFCRDNAFDVPETILRASKITRYIELGRNSDSATVDYEQARKDFLRTKGVAA